MVDELPELPELAVVSMQPTDWPEVRRIYEAGIATGDATFEAVAPDWQAFDAAKLSSHRCVATTHGSLIGWAAVSAVSSRAAYAGVVELSIFVDPRCHGQGVGSRLMAHVIASTESAGIWTIQSHVFPENVASQRLHVRHGFRVVGTRQALGRVATGPRAGSWRDVVLLERRSNRSGLNG